MESFVVFLLLLVTAFVNCDQSTDFAPIVQLKDGKVRGIVESVDDSQVYLYQGIRYGQSERFEKPKPASPWSEVYNATIWREACPQPDIGTPPFVPPLITDKMSEDCLFLSVWRPSRESKNPRCVMVWIHGGAFYGGTIFSQFFDGKYLSSQGDVIVVTINYRLGALGFLYGGTEDTPGNVGLHDQILALKWVKDNVHSFGGDPNRITIFGESAGGMSVGLLTISPLAKGLFHRGIMQSGGPNSYYGAVTKEHALEFTKTLVRNVNCKNTKIEDEIKCLKTKNFTQILNGFESDIMKNHQFIPIFGDDFMPLKPSEAIKTGEIANKKVDMIYGVVSNEGSRFVDVMAPDVRSNQTNSMSFSSAIVDIENLMRIYNVPDGSKVAEFYGQRLRTNTQTALRDMVSYAWGNYHLVCPTVLFAEDLAKLSSQNHKFYSYILARPTYQLDCTTPWMPVCHSEDLVYLFMHQLIVNDTEVYQLALEMVQAWANFAKTGNPGSIGETKWEQAVEGENYATKLISLDGYTNEMVENFYVDNCDKFWKPKMF